VISNDLIAVYEDTISQRTLSFGSGKSPRTFGESRTEEIGCGGCCQHRGQRGIGKTYHRFLISMSAGGVACNPWPSTVLENSRKILSFHPREVAHNSSIPAHLLIRLNDDPDIRVER
jgi:hypothetical protein